MRTWEVMDEDAWCGLSALRQVLSDKRHEFENRHYPTSASHAQFDHYRRFALLGALVAENRDLLAHALVAGAPSEGGVDRLQAAWRELDQLAGVLHSLAAQLDSVAADVRFVQAQIGREGNGR